jgi:hypothetical protein
MINPRERTWIKKLNMAFQKKSHNAGVHRSDMKNVILVFHKKSHNAKRSLKCHEKVFSLKK